MELTREQLTAMAAAIGLNIPAADAENVRLRLSALLTEMEGIERELGAEMGSESGQARARPACLSS